MYVYTIYEYIGTRGIRIQMSHVSHMNESLHPYGVATISRLLKIIGLFCRISSLLQGSFAKETYNFKEPTNRSHPISREGRGVYQIKINRHTHTSSSPAPRHVSLENIGLFHRALLQKRPIILRSLRKINTHTHTS